MQVNERQLSALAGWSCVAIGAYHVVAGAAASVPGIGAINATVDSRERFYNAIFAGYGWEWLRAAHSAQPTRDAERLAAIMAVGGVARLVSIGHRGSPHWFQNSLTAVEFAFPAAVFAVTRGLGGPR